MTKAVNRRIVLVSRPAGFPKESDFRLESCPVEEPRDGQFLVRVEYLSLDPYMRGRMSDAKSYAASVQIGECLVGGGVGRVEVSRHPKFAVGDVVVGANFGWQEYARSAAARGSRKLMPGWPLFPPPWAYWGCPG